MFAAIKHWRCSPDAQLEWDRFHAKPLPWVALAVWLGVSAHVVAMSFPWGLTPLQIPVPGETGWQSTLLASDTTPARWVHAAIFWVLPWILMEWRLGVGRQSRESLEPRATALIRLFGYALLFYPLLRLGFFGLSRMFYRGLPAPTMIDAILLDTNRPIIERYLWTLATEWHFALITFLLVVCRVRIAQWAAVIVPRPPARLLLYALPSLIMTMALIILRMGLADPMLQADVWRQAEPSVYFVRVMLPWSVVIAGVALLVAHIARQEAERCSRPLGSPQHA